jgi:hypothetical protein
MQLTSKTFLFWIRFSLLIVSALWISVIKEVGQKTLSVIISKIKIRSPIVNKIVISITIWYFERRVQGYAGAVISEHRMSSGDVRGSP